MKKNLKLSLLALGTLVLSSIYGTTNSDVVYANTPAYVQETTTETEEPEENFKIALSDWISNVLMNISMQHVEELLEGNFTSIINRLSDETAEVLTYEMVESAWNLTIPLGGYIDVADSRVFKSSGSPVAHITLEFEYGIANIFMIFNEQLEIIGLLFQPTITFSEELISNEYFTETKIIVGDEFPLYGILTTPNNVENAPVAILVQGSGQTDMNLTAGFLQPFRDIAHGLAENGVATIRYNKRFFQFPQAMPANMTIEQEVLYDVNSAIKLAYENEDLGDIYIIGLSLGGMLAPRIASENEQVAGIVSLAGTPRQIEDLILEQVLLQFEMFGDTLGLTPEEIEKQTYQIKLLMEEIRNFDLTLDLDELAEYEPRIFFNFPESYFISLNRVSTPEVLKQLTIPMLILQGAEDLQVYADIDFVLWQELLQDRENVTFILYENLNHFFTNHIEELGFAQFLAPANVDSEVILDISEWINSLKELMI